jgi:phosphate:Na+ symporter
MHPALFLLHLAGAVMLLLWAVRMVRTGMERAHGHALKGALRRASESAPRSAATGVVLAIALQSATAVGVLAAGFAATGLLTTSAGIAALLGADLGSAVVVKILTFDLSHAIPALLVAGAVMFLKFESRAIRQSGRILLGIALILLALKMVGEATAPLREHPMLPAVAAWLGRDPVSSFLVAGLFAWVVHSSVATVLLLATLAAHGVLDAPAVAAMVLGANAGGALIAVWLTRSDAAIARRIPMGNLLLRAPLALAALAGFAWLRPPLEMLGETPQAVAVHFHLAFNAALLLIGLPLVRPVAALAARLLSETPEPAAAAKPPSALDRSLLGKPKLALASATRELLRMAETVETMLRPAMELLDANGREEAARLCALDREVNRMHTGIKLYVAEVNRGTLDPEEAARGIAITDFAINLEHAGDILSKKLLPLVEDKAKKGLEFSPEGREEMAGLHARVVANLQLALNVLVSSDLDSARQLIREKEALRDLERESHTRHLRRLQSGRPESIETSSMHLEVVRSLKEVNSLFASVAYPILIESGHLLDSRLARAV